MAHTTIERFVFRNVVLVEEPSLQSRAAYVLLVKQFVKLNGPPEWVKWLRARDAWINKQDVLSGGNLVCVGCGKQHLKLSGNKSDTATVDHKHPVSLGGSKYDENNFQILCRKCNSKKSNIPYQDWVRNSAARVSPF